MFACQPSAGGKVLRGHRHLDRGDFDRPDGYPANRAIHQEGRGARERDSHQQNDQRAVAAVHISSLLCLLSARRYSFLMRLTATSRVATGVAPKSREIGPTNTWSWSYVTVTFIASMVLAD